MHELRLFSLVLGLSTIPAFACQVERAPQAVSETSAILGGTPATQGQFPTVVAILMDQGRRGLCTGTLVAPDLVLTAAHCISTAVTQYPSQEEVTANTLVIVDGTNLQQGTGMIAAVAETIPHPDFGNPIDPDVGLIRLSQPLTDRVPTPLNLVAVDAPIGVDVTMVGYGLSEPGNQMSAGTAMVLDSKSSVACSNGVPDASFLCFDQTNGTGKCSGDSGGPSFATIGGVAKVVGITSFGDQDCAAFGADMRVDAARLFLAENAPELLCGADGNCEASCGANGAPSDPDCGAACTRDEECPNAGDICNVSAGQCVAGPDADGGLGSTCVEGQMSCVAGTMCGDDPNGGMVCTQPCDLEANNCPSGFECIGGEAGNASCFSSDQDGGGCRAGGASGPFGMAAILLALGLIGFSRRRQSESLTETSIETSNSVDNK